MYTESELIETDYGTGAAGSVNYQMDSFYGGVGLDLGFQYGVLEGSASTDGALDNDCKVETFLGVDFDCVDRADTENKTSFGEASALAVYPVGSGDTTLLAGLSYLKFDNELYAEYLYPGGNEYFADRNTEFTGFGLKIGARHSIPLQNGMSVNLEGFAGQYRGDRTMQIDETRSRNGPISDSVTLEKKANVTVFEVAPSISIPAAWATPGATIEFGVSYKLFSGVVDTRNVTPQGVFDAFEVGKEDDAVSATSIFAGITIPMN